MKTILSLFCSVILFLNAQGLRAQCGVERWDVKVLDDADTSSINWLPVNSSVEELDQLPQETIGISTPRLTSEKVVYQIDGDITFFKKESDQDIHLVLVGKDSSMVVEIPSPDCPEVLGTSRATVFAEERAWVANNLGNPTTSFKAVTPPKHVRVTGLSFQDFLHGQKGIGANGRELHALLSITSATEAVNSYSKEVATVSIMPNPVRGNAVSIGITPRLGQKITQVSIIDVGGKEVMRPQTPLFFSNRIQFSLPTNELPNGTYFVRVVSLTGSSETKFIVEH